MPLPCRCIAHEAALRAARQAADDGAAGDELAAAAEAVREATRAQVRRRQAIALRGEWRGREVMRLRSERGAGVRGDENDEKPRGFSWAQGRMPHLTCLAGKAHTPRPKKPV